MYYPGSLPPLRPIERTGAPGYVDGIRRSRQLTSLTDDDFRKINAVYLGMTSFVDFLLGRLLDALDVTGLADDTAILFFSDHGDWAGDYGLVEKWPNALDDLLTRVPLIVRVPGGRAGHVVREPVELFDIMATCLDLAQVESRHTHFARSLVPELHGASGDPDRAVFAEGGYDLHEPHCFEGRPDDAIAADPDGIYYPKGLLQQEHPHLVARATMIRTAEHKLIRRPREVSELYDLTTDPRETNNLYDQPAYADVQARLEARLLDWYIAASDAVPFEKAPRNLPE